MEKSDAPVLILGQGRSGRAAQNLLETEGTPTVIFSEEENSFADLEKFLSKTSPPFCVVSPGFSIHHPWVKSIACKGIPLRSELELGASRHLGKIIAVTGSNGKSTAVKWIFEALSLAGKKAAIGGNYGIPACEVVCKEPDLEWLVLEVSSFQLETVHDFSPNVAILLNLLPNHLDRHGTMEAYLETKWRIFGTASNPVSTAIFPQKYSTRPISARRSFRFGASSESDFYFKEGHIFWNSDKVADLSETLFDSPIIGPCTGAACVAAAKACEIPFSVMEKAAKNFNPLPHRLEKLGKIAGVTYVNDSKATNMAALSTAVQSIHTPIHLIAGGRAKESDYTFIKEVLEERVGRIYLVGEVSKALNQAWSGVCSCSECKTLEAAFFAAQSAAQPGDTVLLSPGCASFDQFRGFEERGELFRSLFCSAREKEKGTIF